MNVTVWAVHNVTSHDPGPTVPWPWDDARCAYHYPGPKPAAAGLVLMDGHWQPRCADGLRIAARYRRPYAEPAQTADEDP